MPFRTIRVGTKYAVQNVDTKHVHGFTTQSNAEAQLRILKQYDKYKKTHKKPMM